MHTHHDAIALFSGGLDSILAVKTVEEQGLKVKCLHLVSSFFGKPGQVGHWRAALGVDVDVVDVSAEFVTMLLDPPHGYGSVVNPCVDCKILMMRLAAAQRERYGARFVVTGEVLGQRPMSQRRDTLNVIRRESGLGDALLRPLSAQHLPESAAEREGLLDRSKLPDIVGRGRTRQLLLAARYGITDIPTPAGGCRLTERENARRYYMLLTHMPAPTAADFALANVGRQFWALLPGAPCWLSVGRNQADNAALTAAARPDDLLFRLVDMPGPLGLARGGAGWPAEALREAAALTASFAPRALQAGSPVRVSAQTAGSEQREELCVTPCREGAFTLPGWEEVRAGLHEIKRAFAQRQAG